MKSLSFIVCITYYMDIKFDIDTIHNAICDYVGNIPNSRSRNNFEHWEKVKASMKDILTKVRAILISQYPAGQYIAFCAMLNDEQRREFSKLQLWKDSNLIKISFLYAEDLLDEKIELYINDVIYSNMKVVIL